ncbi:MAG: matrixin family metalloprotease [Proteobacteria bacterium]|nr:MAG: matrixin family metalloprotease [Pseudomonadota bacterium]
MKFKIFLLACIFLSPWIPSNLALAFVHINSVKPHLPVSPESPTITFQWNGEAPPLGDKSEVLDGVYAYASDSQMMEALLFEAMSKWNSVETSYLNFEVGINGGAVIDAEDEIYAIVVETQDSKAVAAAALPNFVSSDKGDSPFKQSGRIIFDCDISIASTKVSAKSLLNTITHELGHCVGLGHPHSNYHSIMSYANIGEHGELGLDDKAGITFLYPEPSESQKVKYMTTCGSLGAANANNPSAAFVLLVPLLGFLFMRIKKRTG